MTYDDAQKMIDNPSNMSELAVSVRNLNKLAKIIRGRRMADGALTLASTQVKFSFDDETHNPTDVSLYNLVEANYLVEEYMLLGNIYVAEKILTHFPSNSVLRKHSTPKPKQIKEFARLLNTLGYNLDYSSSKNLADSLDLIQRQNDPFFNKLVRVLTTRTMNEALYFCTADADYPEFRHYGLACNVYTHFTSPIRRYADVLVHRLLAAAIDIESLPKNMALKQRLTKQTDKMNMRNRNARNAGRASSDYNIYLMFRVILA
jgi:exosome complex exonuclease DIS3/RRP44